MRIPIKKLTDSKGSLYHRIVKFSALAIPVAVIIAGLFLPMNEIVRQALIGVVFVWIYLGAMTGFSYLW